MRPRKYKIKREDIKELQKNGLTYDEIAEYFKCSRQTISKRMKEAPTYDAEFTPEKDKEAWANVMKVIQDKVSEAYTRGFVDGCASERAKYGN